MATTKKKNNKIDESVEARINDAYAKAAEKANPGLAAQRRKLQTQLVKAAKQK